MFMILLVAACVIGFVGSEMFNRLVLKNFEEN
jgi:hypothetical protein